MLDHTMAQLELPGRPMAPSWARALTPHVAELRPMQLVSNAQALVEVCLGDEAAMATAVVPEATSLAADGFCAAVTNVYELVLGKLRATGFAHPVRIWTFVPGIHDAMGEGMDRYRVFNTGRYDALTRWFGGAAALQKVLPAASAVGHPDTQLLVCALGLRTPGVPVENSRQTPAFDYSRAQGPRPPCFARAMVAKLPIGTRLLVSGTASIRGENSVHPGSLSRQLEETFENIHRLAQDVPGADRFAIHGIETARVYFARAADRAMLVSAVSGWLPAAATVELFPAWICRAELLVEIEATIAPS